MSARYIQPLRSIIQIAFLLLCLLIGIRFAGFVSAVLAGGVVPPRPGGIEAFLPISGLFGTAAWLKGGGINPLHPAAVVIFVAVVAGAWLLRRSFCSWICPVGTLSEWLWKAGFHKFNRNLLPPRWLDIGLRGIKYLLLVFFLFTALSWSLEALHGFLYSGYHAISDVQLLQFFRAPSVTTLAVLGLLLALSLPLRNPFCRYLCPYGALLGVVALLSPLAVQRDLKRCVSCGVCNQVCPSRIDVMHAKRVNDPECLGCWRCISHCRVHTALSMRALGRYAVPGILFALLVVGLFWGATRLGKATGHWDSVVSPAEYRELMGR
ncbi:MAG: 4Fe-4S binding protein [Trichlorobacter sp.]|jgi:polyferredoxin